MSATHRVFWRSGVTTGEALGPLPGYGVEAGGDMNLSAPIDTRRPLPMCPPSVWVVSEHQHRAKEPVNNRAQLEPIEGAILFTNLLGNSRDAT